MRKIFLFILFFLLIQCRSNNTEYVTLSTMNEQFSYLTKSDEARKQILELKQILKSILILDSTPENNDFSEEKYIIESLDSIKKASQSLSLSTESLDSNNLLISSSSDTSLTTSHLFLIELEPEYFNLKKIEQFSLQTQINDKFIYGYQALYPKGFLSSLLWALSNVKRDTTTTRYNVRILITRNKDSFENITPILKKNISSEATFVIPMGNYPAIGNIDGEVTWTLSIPQDTTWLTDISTIIDEKNSKKIIIKYPNRIEGGGVAPLIKEVPIDVSVDDIIYNYNKTISQNIVAFSSAMNNIVKDPLLKVSTENQKVLALNTLMTYLSNMNFDSFTIPTAIIGNTTTFNKTVLRSVNTRKGQLNFVFSSFVSRENKETFKTDLENYYKNHFQQADASSNYITPVLTINSYRPSYSLERQNSNIQKNAELLKKEFVELTNFKNVDYKDLYLDSFPYNYSSNILFMGLFFVNPKLYVDMDFIPESKLYLDSKILYDFLYSGTK